MSNDISSHESEQNVSGRYGVLLLCGVCLLAFVGLSWSELVDDSYIYFRYAGHLADGQGYVFNAGERVEGATGMLWTVILSGFLRLGISPEAATRVIGIACLLGTMVLVWRACRGRQIPMAVTLMIVALMFNRFFVMPFIMGLETGLYVFLSALMVYELVTNEPDILFRGRSTWIIGITGALMLGTRPESVFLLGLLLVVFCIFHRRRWKRIGGMALLWVVVFGSLTVWRWLYFGDVIPNSVRDKSAIGMMLRHGWVLWDRMLAGAEYIVKWGLWHWPVVILGGAGWLVLFRRDRFKGCLFGVLIVSWIAPVLANGGDWMPGYRLLVPLAAALLIVSPQALGCLNGTSPGGRRALTWGCIAAGLLSVLTGFPYATKGLFVAPRWPAGVCYQKTADVLRPYLSAKTLIAPEAIGQIGWELMDVPILDFFGLTDRYIARNGVMPSAVFTFGRHHYEYTMSRKPDVFLFHSSVHTHIACLNRFGYSDAYKTYRITDAASGGVLLVGIVNAHAVEWSSALRSAFTVEPVPTANVKANESATWPEGFR